jgi:acrylyl-CoA reductase (NADPH)
MRGDSGTSSDRDREGETGQNAGLLPNFDEPTLMEGDVTVGVEWSTLNYKDGLAITRGRRWCAAFR